MKKEIRELLAFPKDLSETGTMFHLIMPFFKHFGWEIGMSENIIFEDTTVTNRRVDIKFSANGKIFFLEAKRVEVELSNRDFEQLTSYLNSDKIANKRSNSKR